MQRQESKTWRHLKLWMRHHHNIDGVRHCHKNETYIFISIESRQTVGKESDSLTRLELIASNIKILQLIGTTFSMHHMINQKPKRNKECKRYIHCSGMWGMQTHFVCCLKEQFCVNRRRVVQNKWKKSCISLLWIE